LRGWIRLSMSRALLAASPYPTLFRSLRDRIPGGADPGPGRFEPALGESGAARKSVVDEHGGGEGVGMHRGGQPADVPAIAGGDQDRKSTRLNSSHVSISYAALCLKKD